MGFFAARAWKMFFDFLEAEFLSLHRPAVIVEIGARQCGASIIESQVLEVQGASLGSFLALETDMIYGD
jgi:hypothetical protein